MTQEMTQKQKDAYTRMDEILFYLWDPIGMGRTNWARNEYESYVSKLYEIAMAADDPKPIQEYLEWITREMLDMFNGFEKNVETGELIFWIAQDAKS
jgi:hypothetical protein